MASRKSSITAQINLAGQAKFKNGLQELSSAARKTGKDISSIGGGLGAISAGQRFSGFKSSLGELGRTYSGLSAVVKDVAQLISKPLKANADYSDLKDGLTAIEGSAESAAESLSFLRAVSREQTLSFPGLVEAQKVLVSLGYSAAEARDFLREMANMAEASGTGIEGIAAVISTLTKASEKGETSLRDLMKLGDGMPAIRKVLSEEFGASSAADMEKLDLTSRELFDGILAGLRKIQTAKASLNERALDFDTTLMMGADEGAANLPGRTAASDDPEARAERIAELQERSAQRKLEAAQKVLAEELAMADAEKSMALAEESRDDEKILAARTELEMLKERKKLVTEMGLGEAQALEHTKRRVAAEIAGANVARDAAKAQSRSSNARSLSELEARAGGMSDRRFKKLQESNQMEDETQRLIAEGYSPAEARNQAGRKVAAESRIAENEDRASRGLGKRIRSRKGDDATRARFSRMSEGQRSGLERLSHNESAWDTFGRKSRGGIAGYSEDDPMAIRPYESNLRPRQSAPGARSRGTNPESGGSVEGSTGVGAQIVAELKQLRAEVARGHPSANDRGRPISTSQR